MGYHWAGFDIVGVDREPQPNYPFMFVQDDALSFLGRNRRHFAAVHASPPCQFYSTMSQCRPGLAEKYPDLVPSVQAAFDRLPVPWVIENVPRSPLRNPVELCGQMFGLELYRHRLFETSFAVEVPLHPDHTVPASRAGHWTPGTIMSVSGHVAPVSKAREIMGIDWTTREELAEAIPPAYSQFVGRQLIGQLMQAAA